MSSSSSADEGKLIEVSVKHESSCGHYESMLFMGETAHDIRVNGVIGEALGVYSALASSKSHMAYVCVDEKKAEVARDVILQVLGREIGAIESGVRQGWPIMGRTRRWFVFDLECTQIPQFAEIIARLWGEWDNSEWALVDTRISVEAIREGVFKGKSEIQAQCWVSSEGDEGVMVSARKPRSAIEEVLRSRLPEFRYSIVFVDQ